MELVEVPTRQGVIVAPGGCLMGRSPSLALPRLVGLRVGRLPSNLGTLLQLTALVTEPPCGGPRECRDRREETSMERGEGGKAWAKRPATPWTDAARGTRATCGLVLHGDFTGKRLLPQIITVNYELLTVLNFRLFYCGAWLTT